jgi:hypothetical protein
MLRAAVGRYSARDVAKLLTRLRPRDLFDFD